MLEDHPSPESVATVPPALPISQGDNGASNPPQPTATTPENELAPKKKTPVATGIGAKVRRLAGGLFANAGFTKGKGRPRKCRACGGSINGCDECNFTGLEPGKADAPLADLELRPDRAEPISARSESALASPASPAVAVAAPVADSRSVLLWRRLCGVSVDTGLGGLELGTKFLAGMADIDPNFTDKTLAEHRPKKARIDDWIDSFDAIAAEKGWKPENPNQANFYLATANLLTPYLLMSGAFIEEIMRKRRAEKKREESQQ